MLYWECAQDLQMYYKDKIHNEYDKGEKLRLNGKINWTKKYAMRYFIDIKIIFYYTIVLNQ